MKTINTVVAAMALSTLSFGVFAAEPVTASQAQNMNKIGVVSADGASTLDALEAKLAEKAAAVPVPVDTASLLPPTTIN
ncbi:DUF1471 domain-containing protein [Escherichia coli]|nr:DUF1471 domain-containing protein [Escherichia coli]